LKVNRKSNQDELTENKMNVSKRTRYVFIYL